MVSACSPTVDRSSSPTSSTGSSRPTARCSRRRSPRSPVSTAARRPRRPSTRHPRPREQSCRAPCVPPMSAAACRHPRRSWSHHRRSPRRTPGSSRTCCATSCAAAPASAPARSAAATSPARPARRTKAATPGFQASIRTWSPPPGSASTRNARWDATRKARAPRCRCGSTSCARRSQDGHRTTCRCRMAS